MPELPEVESLRRALEGAVVGRSFTEIDVRLPKVFRPAPGLGARSLIGARIETVRRRGKYLIVGLSNDLTLVLHLRLSGQLVLVRGGRVAVAGGHPVPSFGAPLPHKATHLTLDLDDGSRLYFTDIRQFGFCQLMPTAAVAGYLEGQRLGPGALDPELTVDALAAILCRRAKAKLKPLLLDQTAVAGLGNIYADEALWRARLHPLRAAGSLSEAEAARLHGAIRSTLEHALTDGVARVINGRAEPDRDFPAAHGREGQPCQRCGTPIVRLRLGGRSTYFCPACQPEATSASA